MNKNNQNITIRGADNSDFDSIWRIFHNVIRAMDTYAFDPKIPKEDAYKIWMSSVNQVYVAIIDNEIVGTYYIKPNQPGFGSHIANAAYMVDPNKQGFGVGKAMALHSLEEAKKSDYIAMQFNFVVSSNTNAVNLWKKMGFKIIGISPQSFKHYQLGFVDTYIMHRFLNDN